MLSLNLHKYSTTIGMLCRKQNKLHFSNYKNLLRQNMRLRTLAVPKNWYSKWILSGNIQKLLALWCHHAIMVHIILSDSCSHIFREYFVSVNLLSWNITVIASRKNVCWYSAKRTFGRALDHLDHHPSANFIDYLSCQIEHVQLIHISVFGTVVPQKLTVSWIVVASCDQALCQSQHILRPGRHEWNLDGSMEVYNRETVFVL